MCLVNVQKRASPKTAASAPPPGDFQAFNVPNDALFGFHATMGETEAIRDWTPAVQISKSANAARMHIL
jgi:hypothetical protein